MADGKIYVIDDTMERYSCLACLEKNGYKNLAPFASVDKALEHMGWSEESPRLKYNLPDVIVTDNDTASLYNGMDLLRAAKDAGIACIMVSGSAEKSQVAIAGGNKARLVDKPLDEKKFIAILKQMLDERGRENGRTI